MVEKSLTIVNDQYALTVRNRGVLKVAFRMGWHPETAIIRIKKALPTEMEQQIYLAIAPEIDESCILPESLAKLLRLYLGHQHMQIEDLSPGSTGRSRFDSFAEYLGECLNLLKNVTKEHPTYCLNILEAGKIVLIFGKDDPERLIEMIDCNLEEMCEIFGINNSFSDKKRIHMCISRFVDKIIPANLRSGTPDILDFREVSNRHSNRRKNLERVFEEKTIDYLEEDSEALRNLPELYWLKKEGII